MQSTDSNKKQSQNTTYIHQQRLSMAPVPYSCLALLLQMIMILLLSERFKGLQAQQQQQIHAEPAKLLHARHSIFTGHVCLFAVAAISLHIPCTIFLVHAFGFAGGGYAVVVMRTAHFAFTVCKSLLSLTDGGTVLRRT